MVSVSQPRRKQRSRHRNGQLLNVCYPAKTLMAYLHCCFALRCGPQPTTFGSPGFAPPHDLVYSSDSPRAGHQGMATTFPTRLRQWTRSFPAHRGCRGCGSRANSQIHFCHWRFEKSDILNLATIRNPRTHNSNDDVTTWQNWLCIVIQILDV